MKCFVVLIVLLFSTLFKAQTLIDKSYSLNERDFRKFTFHFSNDSSGVFEVQYLCNHLKTSINSILPTRELQKILLKLQLLKIRKILFCILT